jgi:hypothetical protein
MNMTKDMTETRTNFAAILKLQAEQNESDIWDLSLTNSLYKHYGFSLCLIWDFEKFIFTFIKKNFDKQ